MSKKQKIKTVSVKELPVGSKIRFPDGTTAYVFKQHNFCNEKEKDVFETDCVSISSNIKEQRLSKIDGELKVEVIDTESEIIFVNQLQDYDCILVQCDGVPVLCKVYDTSQGYIYPQAQHQFYLKPKTGQFVNTDSLIEKKSFVKKMSHGFSCLMLQWNYFQKGRFFFHVGELELHSLRNDADEFEDSQVLITLIEDFEWGLFPEMAEMAVKIIKKYAKNIDMFCSTGEIKKCRKYAQALYQFIDQVYCYDEVRDFFPYAIEDSEIAQDILQFVKEDYGD